MANHSLGPIPPGLCTASQGQIHPRSRDLTRQVTLPRNAGWVWWVLDHLFLRTHILRYFQVFFGSIWINYILKFLRKHQSTDVAPLWWSWWALPPSAWRWKWSWAHEPIKMLWFQWCKTWSGKRSWNIPHAWQQIVGLKATPEISIEMEDSCISHFQTPPIGQIPINFMVKPLCAHHVSLRNHSRHQKGHPTGVQALPASFH